MHLSLLSLTFHLFPLKYSCVKISTRLVAIGLYHFISIYGTSCSDALVESVLGITTDLYHNIFFLHHGTHSNKCMVLLFPPFSHLKSNWRRDSFPRLLEKEFLRLAFSFELPWKDGKMPMPCACLPASFIVSLFIIPFPANESWAMTLHTAPTTSIRVYDLKKFQRLIQVKLKAVSSYNITWIYSCSFYIGFGWYNTRISHSFVKN